MQLNMEGLMSKLKIYLNILTTLLSRLLCWRRNRHRRTSGSLLPITVVTGTVASESSLTPASPDYMYSSSSIVHNYTSHVNGTWNLMQKPGAAPVLNVRTEENEPDYFQELQPTIKRQKKVMVNQNSNGCKLSERLNMSTTATDSIAPDSESLSAVAGGSWAEDDDLLDERELTQSLRTIRTAERERRVAEHQKAIQQREQLRKAKVQKSNFMATKIS